MITHAALSDIGRQRPTNQDRFFADPEHGLFIVADGMADEHAPQITINSLPPKLAGLRSITKLSDPEVAKTIRAAVAELSQDIRDESTKIPERRGMGTTLVLAVIREKQALIAHLGDSRAYLWRDGTLQQLTRDHSLVQMLLDAGRITAEEALHHPAIGELACYVGMLGKAVPTVRVLDLTPGDRLLLCTDGLTGAVSDEELTKEFKRGTPVGELCQSLIGLANAAGGLDNITALTIALD